MIGIGDYAGVRLIGNSGLTQTRSVKRTIVQRLALDYLWERLGDLEFSWADWWDRFEPSRRFEGIVEPSDEFYLCEFDREPVIICHPDKMDELLAVLSKEDAA